MNSKNINYQESSSQNILKGIWKHVKKNRRRQLAFLLLVMVISAFSEVVSLGAVIPFLTALTSPDNLENIPLIKKLFIDLGSYGEKQFILIFSGIFVITSLLAASIRMFNYWLNGRLAALISSDLSSECFKRVLFQPYINHVNNNSSSLITAATSQIQIIVDVFRSVLQMITAIILIIFLLFGILVINWKIALFFIVTFSLLYFLIAINIRKKLIRNGTIIASSSVNQVKAIQEGLGFIRDIILDNSQSKYIDIYRESDFKQRIYTTENLFLRAFPRFVLEATGMIAIALVATVLVISSPKSSIIPILGAIALAAQRLLPSLQIVYSQWAYIKGSKAGQATILSILENSSKSKYSQQKEIYFSKKIVLESICFKYNNSSSLILDNINLEIKKGEKLGLIGKTGAGKSTLVDIIMGLLEPSQGKFFIDETNLYSSRDYSFLNSWRSQIAHVPQNIFLSDSTIAENIALGSSIDQIDFDKLQDAARKAQIFEFIEKHPNNYFQRVGERGLLLSGGQRQRIALARAIYKNKSFLILDEATNALDSKTESDVFEAIKKLNSDLTILIISHKTSTLDLCDRVIKIENGKLLFKKNQ